MTTDLMSLRREVDRLRRELETAFDVAREIGEERNELARQLGEEVATTRKMREALVLVRGEYEKIGQGPKWKTLQIIDAAIASGDGK